MKKFKRLVAILLAILMLVTSVPLASISAFAVAEDLIDIDIYKAQCFAGIAEDPNSEAVEHCSNLFNYYISEELYSPTQSFLDAVYEDENLVADYNEWMAYSLAAEPSSALDLVASKENYYEACIIAMYTKTTVQNNTFKEVLKNKIIDSSNDLIETLCKMKGVHETSQIIEVVDITDPNTITAIQGCVNATYSLATAAEICSVIDVVLKCSADIIDVMGRLAVYGEMVELDKATKLWLTQMYESCDANYDLSFKSALYNLKTASTDYAGAILVDIKQPDSRLQNGGSPQHWRPVWACWLQ